MFYRDGGGYQSTDENDLPLNEIYHMGIIDILTPYDGVKKMEHMFKSINNDPVIFLSFFSFLFFFWFLKKEKKN